MAHVSTGLRIQQILCTFCNLYEQSSIHCTDPYWMLLWREILSGWSNLHWSWSFSKYLMHCPKAWIWGKLSIINSVLKFSPVRFFCLFGVQLDLDQSLSYWNLSQPQSYNVMSASRTLSLPRSLTPLFLLCPLLYHWATPNFSPYTSCHCHCFGYKNRYQCWPIPWAQFGCTYHYQQ